MTKPKRGRPPGTPQPPGTGRKPKPPEQKAKRFTITLPPDLLAWVDEQGTNRSQTIARLLTAAKEYLAQE